MNKFIKPEHDPDVNPVDYYNNHRSWNDVFIGSKYEKILEGWTKNGTLTPGDDPPHGLIKGKQYNKFQALSRIKFKGNYFATINYIASEYLNAEFPYIRVGTDYFKVITKTDRYGVKRKIIKGWKKEEIKGDHDNLIVKRLPRYDDFCIVPDNQNFHQTIDNCYNLYSPFSHRPAHKAVNEKDIPVSYNLMQHIFEDQLHLGLIYMKVLYLHPEQALPILSLVSKERQTGKTTFLNWMQMIFGDNFIQINPEDLTSQFNSSYATKNIIALDETVIEKSHAVEKLKSIATAKSISVNQKFVANYSIPFFGKVILCTNKENDFMRIDEEEIRFWVRKVKSIGKINTKIEKQLNQEIPSFLRFISDLPEIDFSRSRMVFTSEEIKNDQLESIKQESWSWLRKELYIYLEEFFSKNDGVDQFLATASDIKAKFFERNNQVNSSYIIKVLKDEMKMHQGDLQRYSPFDNDPMIKTRARPFLFKRIDFIDVTEENQKNDEIPF